MIQHFFYIDALSIIMLALVFFIFAVTIRFSVKYMKYDSEYKTYLIRKVFLITGLALFVCCDNIWLFTIINAINNITLAKMITHKPSWKAARKSGDLALRIFLISFVMMIGASYLLVNLTGEMSIQAIVYSDNSNNLCFVALMMIFIAAMCQSAIWPMHKWLISSVNAPMPVSALIYSSIGGFILARFAPLINQEPTLLNIIFIFGAFTAIIGTIWKLIQSDVKKMLACSTMSQMGFIIMQCGLGLAPAAIAHLFWHAIFKSYLILSSSTVNQNKKIQPPSLFTLAISILCGSLSVYAFAYMSGRDFIQSDTSLILTFVALITGAQFAITLSNPLKYLPLSLIAGGIYGLNIYSIEFYIESQPQELNLFHFGFLVLAAAFWITMFHVKSLYDKKWFKAFYVWMLNLSQPRNSTITSHRISYKYK